VSVPSFDDHDVREHYDNGAELVDDFAGKKRQLPEDVVPGLLTVAFARVIACFRVLLLAPVSTARGTAPARKERSRPYS
jgi:hypothetical protein